MSVIIVRILTPFDLSYLETSFESRWILDEKNGFTKPSFCV